MEYDSALRLFNPQTYGGRTVHITLKEFLAKIRRNGMDIIFPQIDHDQVNLNSKFRLVKFSNLIV
jgi:hypothetical protein